NPRAILCDRQQSLHDQGQACRFRMRNHVADDLQRQRRGLIAHTVKRTDETQHYQDDQHELQHTDEPYLNRTRIDHADIDLSTPRTQWSGLGWRRIISRTWAWALVDAIIHHLIDSPSCTVRNAPSDEQRSPRPYF